MGQAKVRSAELPPDDVQRLHTAIPSQEEMDMVKAWGEEEGNDPADLAVADRFFLECTRVKRLRGKLRALEFKVGEAAGKACGEESARVHSGGHEGVSSRRGCGPLVIH